uniref:AT-rich interactive domain-containing protein 2 n=1 Tax=Lygus hesperus TaxID=30085 RepID=A0A0K8S4F2_LYGHE
MAQIKDQSEPCDYDKEKERFLQELTHFHETRGTPSRRPPQVNGHEIDLYKLYTLVTNRGGWVKVNARNEWEQIIGDFDIPLKCVNASVAIKQVYLRYLDRYEKIHYLGEIGERGGDDDEDSRHRRWSARSLHSVPLTYNHGQHNVNESLREYNGLSVNLYKPSEFEKLALSLISPLPNEQDFAINVCTLLSNEGKHCLKLDKSPRFLHALLAHAAVFSNSTFRGVFSEMYGTDRGHTIDFIWHDTIADPYVLRLADESNFSDIPNDRVPSPEPMLRHGFKPEPEDNELFCLGRTLGIQDYVGQRVCQIATVVRNLTFVSDNVPIMGKDLTFLRFVLLCCSCDYNGLQQMGWDMLGNVASEITVQSPLIDDVIFTATKGLLSEDRSVILSSLEVLNKLAQCEKNEDILLRTLNQEVYNRVCSFLTLHDIMLLVYTLECLNAISSLGEKACNSILRVRGSLDVLVSLITVEAQSYGPKACIQMRVVETVTGGGTGVVCQTTQSSSVSSTTTTVSSVTTATASTALNTLTVTSSTTTATPVSTSTLLSSISSPTVLTNVASSPPAAAPTVVNQPQTSTAQNQQPQHSSPVSRSTTASSASSSSTTNAAHATQQVAQENEQFALAWLRSTFEPVTSGRIEQAELYKQYINYCAKIGRRGVIAPLHFPRCVRSVFGGTVGPKPVTTGDTTHHFYEGINLRAKPLIPQVPSTAGQSSVVPNTPSPILKAQLSAPPKPTPSTTQPLKAQSGGGTSPPPGDPGTTSLIKTLLASKVTQRQQQQKLLQQQHSPGQLNPLTKATPDESPTKSMGTQINQYHSKSLFTYKVNGIRNNNETTEKAENSNGQMNFMCVNENSNSKPPPLAPLSSKFTSTQATTINSEETGSTSNSMASISSSFGMRDNCSVTGEEGDNSMSSLDGFLLNGVPSALDLDDTNSKDSAPKSMMLADLLDKNVDRNEPPVVNGSLRIGEKGLELIRNRVDERTSVLCSTKSSLNGIETDLEISRDSLKRPSSGPDCDTAAKKPHLNGDIKEETTFKEEPVFKEEPKDVKEESKDVKEEPPEEGNVSSTAANLYAAFAADALEDEPIEELQQQAQQPLLLASANSRQILVAAGGQLTQRVVVGGQHYVVAQPQTALVQGQTQTVLVAQTPQQQGTAAKTIIILQPQNVQGAQQQKVIVQRLQSPPPTSAPPPPLLSTNQQQHQTIATLPSSMKVITTPPKPTAIINTSQPSPSPQMIQKTIKNVKQQPHPSQTASSQTSTHVPSPTIPTMLAPCATPVMVASTSPISSAVSSASSPTVTHTNVTTVANAANTVTVHAVRPPEQQAHFLCEWRGCMKSFKSGNEVYMHAVDAHCPQGTQEIQCLWERCDAMKRKRLSLMTHLQDKHCNADVMRMMAVRRKQLSVTGRSEIPAPIPAAPHPGYAPNAAFHAIKRHALEFVNPKELQDDNEGPVTKSIRLTAALILRNLVIFSTNGRRHLTRFEPHLASVALSNVESSRTIAHVLFDMNQSR